MMITPCKEREVSWMSLTCVLAQLSEGYQIPPALCNSANAADSEAREALKHFPASLKISSNICH